MNLEREAKFKLKRDPSFYIDYLLRNGFKLIDSVLEQDTYFKHPCRDMKSRDEAFRIRSRRSLSRNSTVFSLCYKGPRRTEGLVKVREELEVEVRDLNVMREILLKLGFEEYASLSKYREVYAHGDNKVYLDYLVGVGWFLEIESSDLDFIKKLYNELIDDLEVVRETYLEICLSRGKCVSRVD